MTIEANLYFSEEWVVLGKENCPWCTRIRAYFDTEGLDYRYYDLAHYPELREWAIAQNLKTVPQVYHLGLRIGGYEDTRKYLDNPKDISHIGN